jgi:hypothetical protein
MSGEKLSTLRGINRLRLIQLLDNYDHFLEYLHFFTLLLHILPLKCINFFNNFIWDHRIKPWLIKLIPKEAAG